MVKIIATRPLSVTRYNPPLHGTVSQISIEQVLCQIDGNYMVYEAERTITVNGGDWKRQISTEKYANEATLKEFGL